MMNNSMMQNMGMGRGGMMGHGQTQQPNGGIANGMASGMVNGMPNGMPNGMGAGMMNGMGGGMGGVHQQNNMVGDMVEKFGIQV